MNSSEAQFTLSKTQEGILLHLLCKDLHHIVFNDIAFEGPSAADIFSSLKKAKINDWDIVPASLEREWERIVNPYRISSKEVVENDLAVLSSQGYVHAESGSWGKTVYHVTLKGIDRAMQGKEPIALIAQHRSLIEKTNKTPPKKNLSEEILLYFLCTRIEGHHRYHWDNGGLSVGNILSDFEKVQIKECLINPFHRFGSLKITNPYKASREEVMEAVASLLSEGYIYTIPHGRPDKVRYNLTTKGIDKIMEGKNPLEKVTQLRALVAESEPNPENKVKWATQEETRQQERNKVRLQYAVTRAGEQLGELQEKAERMRMYQDPTVSLSLKDVRDVLISTLGDGSRTRAILDALQAKEKGSQER